MSNLFCKSKSLKIYRLVNFHKDNQFVFTWLNFIKYLISLRKKMFAANFCIEFDHFY